MTTLSARTARLSLREQGGLFRAFARFFGRGHWRYLKLLAEGFASGRRLERAAHLRHPFTDW